MQNLHLDLFKFIQTVNNLLKDGLQLSDFPEETQERIKNLLQPIVDLRDEIKAVSDALESISTRLEAVEKVLKASKTKKSDQ